MKIKFRLKIKLLLSILAATLVIYIFSIGYVSQKLKTSSYSSAINLTNSYAKEKALEVKSELNIDMDVARTISNGFSDFKNLSFNEIKKFHGGILKKIIESNPEFYSVWVQWDYKIIDPKWKREGGRVRFITYREGDKIVEMVDTKDTSLVYNRTAYYEIRENPKETVLDPYLYSYEEGKEPILETSVVVPIILDGEHFGQAGIDLGLERFQELMSQINPFGGYATLISNNGTYIYHPNKNFIGKLLSECQSSLDSAHQIMNNIQSGEIFSFNQIENNKEFYKVYAPFNIGNSTENWYISLSAPIDVILKEAQAVYQRSIYISLLGFVFFAVLVWLIAHNITFPLRKATKVISELSKGEINESNRLVVNSTDEIGDIAHSVNELIDGLNKTTNFAFEIGHGNLDTNFELLSEKDSLGKALLEMRSSLKSAREQEEKRKKDDQKVNWTNEGLAHFSELLRLNTDDIEEFSYSIISNLVKYVKSNQGGIFIINDDDENDIFIQLYASYAYDRRKYIEKRIELGVGLIGRCIKESETIYMTELPANYISIQSGLGDEIPTSLLLVPLKLNESVYGVIEIASFEEIEDYKIKFIEKIGESIAATISTVKINIRTKSLLEETKQQSEELASQEEEMRQNMEELQATQEESARKSAEMESLISAINATSYVTEYDLSGKLIFINETYLRLLGKSKKELLGSHHTDSFELTEDQASNYKNFWNAILNGKIQKQKVNINLRGKIYTFMETYTPIYNEYSEVYKVLKIANDISEYTEKK